MSILVSRLKQERKEFFIEKKAAPALREPKSFFPPPYFLIKNSRPIFTRAIPSYATISAVA
jgi:hypothetical protein